MIVDEPARTVEIAGWAFPVSALLGPRARAVYEAMIAALEVKGDLAECGVFEGTTARGMAEYCRRHAPERAVHLFDSFTGFPDVITAEERQLSTWAELGPGLYAGSLEAVRASLRDAANVRIHPGRFIDTLPDFDRPLCFVHSDSDLYQSTLETIELADRLLVPGGRIVFDDYGNPRLPGVKLAVDRYLDPARYQGQRLPGSIQYLAIRRPT